MSTLIIGDRIIRTSDPILQRKQAAQGMQQAGIGSLSGRTTDDDRGRQAREIQRDAGVETITRDSDRDYDENTERLIAQAKAERGIIDEPKKTGIFGIDFSNLGLPTINPALGFIQGSQNTNQVLEKLSKGLELNSNDKLTLINLRNNLAKDDFTNLFVKYAEDNDAFLNDMFANFQKEYGKIEELVEDQQDNLQSYFDRMDKMGLGETTKTMAGDLTGTRDTKGITTLEDITDDLKTEGLAYLKATDPQAYYRLRPNDPDLANESFVSTGDRVADRRFNAKIMEARALANDARSRQAANMGIMASSPAIATPASQYGIFIGKPGPFIGNFVDTDGDGIDDRFQTGPGQPRQPIVSPKQPLPVPDKQVVGRGITPFDVNKFYASLPQYTQSGVMAPINLSRFTDALRMFPGATV